MVPAVDTSRFVPVGDWAGGPLRVFRFPLTSAKLEEAEEYVPFGRGFAIPAVGYVVRPDGVHIHFELIDGVPRCVAVEIGEPPPEVAGDPTAGWGPEPARWLTGTYLRDMAIDVLTKKAAQALAVRLYRRPRGAIVGVHVGAPLTAEDLRQAWDHRADVRDVAAITEERLSEKRKPGRKPVPDETLIDVAAAVRKAEANEESIVAAVMGLYPEYVPSTARKYIRLARKRGFLPNSNPQGD